MTTFFVIALALCAILLLYVAVRGRRRAGRPVQPVDLAAFRTLTDREDELFLRQRLPHSRFARLKRQRIGVTMRYVSRIAANAAAVMRVGETAKLSADPKVALAAYQITELATQIRIQCLVAFAKLSLEFAVPSLQLTPAVLVPQYMALRENVQRLGQLGQLKTAETAPLPVAI
jgi:hypothetical protein